MSAWAWLRAEWDRVAGFGFVILGALFLFFGYQGVRDSPFLAEGLAYIASGGLGGIFCLGLGVGLLLSADLHDEWHKLDRIEAALRGEPLPESTELLDLMAGERSLPDATPRPGRSAPVQSAALDQDGATGDPRLSHPMAIAMNWRAGHLSRAMGITTLVLLLPLALHSAGWRRARATPDLDVAMEGLALAAVGTVLALVVIAGYGLWLRMRIVGRERRLFGVYLLEQKLAERRRTQPVWSRAVDVAAPGTGGAAVQVLVSPGLQRFHWAGCPAVAGLTVTSVDRASLDPRLTPCGICGSA